MATGIQGTGRAQSARTPTPCLACKRGFTVTACFGKLAFAYSVLLIWFQTILFPAKLINWRYWNISEKISGERAASTARLNRRRAPLVLRLWQFWQRRSRSAFPRKWLRYANPRSPALPINRCPIQHTPWSSPRSRRNLRCHHGPLRLSLLLNLGVQVCLQIGLPENHSPANLSSGERAGGEQETHRGLVALQEISRFDAGVGFHSSDLEQSGQAVKLWQVGSGSGFPAASRRDCRRFYHLSDSVTLLSDLIAQELN